MTPLIFGHRGAPFLAKENTLESFEKALEVGAEGVELDVRRTKDGVLVCYHDQFIAGRLISQLDYAHLNELSWRQNFKVPTLRQVLELLAGKICLQVEIKQEGYEHEILEEVFKYSRPEGIIFVSFYLGVLKKIKSARPDAQVGLVLGFSLSSIWPLIKFLFGRRQAFSVLDIISVHSFLARAGILRLMPKGLGVCLWEVDSLRAIKKYLNLSSIWAIITNFPDRAVKIRQRLK